MKIRLLFTILLLTSLLLQIRSANDEMPIIAYSGIPDWQTDDSHYKTFRECGFTVSIYPYYQSLDLLIKACRNAEKHGVQVMGPCPEMQSNPLGTAKILRKEKGCFGYFIYDEPNIEQMDGLQKLIAKIKSVDADHKIYVNLLPYYGEWILANTKTADYPTYLKAGVKLDCTQISFDFYPITQKGLRDTWYYNLEKIREQSLLTRKPFWGFVLSTPHLKYPQPTLASLRLQVYSNLVYGAQAIQYFTYWTPNPKTEHYNFHNGPVDQKGNKTQTYRLVQSMNKELKIVSRLFWKSKVVSVHHLGKVPHGTTKQPGLPTNIRSLAIKGKSGAIVSQFTKDNHRYMAIVNKDYNDSMTVKIAYKNSTPIRILKDLQSEPAKQEYSILPGDILIFRLK